MRVNCHSNGISLHKVGRYLGGKEVWGKVMLEYFVGVDHGEQEIMLALSVTVRSDGSPKDV